MPFNLDDVVAFQHTETSIAELELRGSMFGILESYLPNVGDIGIIMDGGVNPKVNFGSGRYYWFPDETLERIGVL